MATFFRRAEQSDACADPRSVRRFSLFKLAVLLLLTGGVLVTLILPDIGAPSLVAPPQEILAGQLNLSGAGTPGSQVELFANEQMLGTVQVDDSGEWTWYGSFPAGQYDLVAQAVANDGRRLVAPEGRASLSVVDRPTLDLSAARREADVAEVTLFGQGTPGSRVRLLWNEKPVAVMQVNGDGLWKYLLPSVGVPSANSFLAQVLDAGGAVLGESDPRSLSFDAPLATAALQIERVGFDRLHRTEAQQTVSGDLSLLGTGEPGAEISVRREGATISTSAIVAPDGRWELSAPLSLAPDAYSFGVRMAGIDGRVLGEGAFDLTVPRPPTLEVRGGPRDIDDFVLDGTAPAGERIILFADDTAIASLDADPMGHWQHQTRLAAGKHVFFAQTAAGLDSDPRAVSVLLARPTILGQSRDEEGNALPGFYGEGRANVLLEIIEGGTVIGQTSVGEDGRWNCECTLAPGAHDVLVREAAEPARASDPLAIAVENPVRPFVASAADPNAPPFRCPDPSPPGLVEGGVYIIGCGESLGAIAARLGVTVEELITYNPQLSRPPMVYFGQRLNVPAGAACSDTTAGS
ncbi:MAG TPA: LysM domain-containing protein [Candidatus Binatia bacterium]|jgi:hypothetical protein|nr:LysM domain-containing protein [Candidatus Binatia bacterium]